MTVKIKRPAAVLEGGPRDQFGYYVDDLEELIRIEEYFGRHFDYKPTDRQVRHPGTGRPGIASHVWVYDP